MVVDVALLAMGMERNGAIGFSGGFGHVRWWAHIEWQHWVVGMGVQHRGWFAEWAREGPSSNYTQ